MMHLTQQEIDYVKSFVGVDFIVIDTETTGVGITDEALSVAIVNQDGDELFYKFVKPTNHRRWDEAEKKHGITWNMVKDEKPLSYYYNDIRAIVDNADLVVGYNLEFDLKRFDEPGLYLHPKMTFDLMRMYAKAYGKWSSYFNDYKWEKLTDVARHYGCKFEAHNSLEDARATAYCYKRFLEDCQNAIPIDPRSTSINTAAYKQPAKKKNVAVTVLIALCFISFLAASISNFGMTTLGYYIEVMLAIVFGVLLVMRFRK